MCPQQGLQIQFACAAVQQQAAAKVCLHQDSSIPHMTMPDPRRHPRSSGCANTKLGPNTPFTSTALPSRAKACPTPSACRFPQHSRTPKRKKQPRCMMQGPLGFRNASAMHRPSDTEQARRVPSSSPFSAKFAKVLVPRRSWREKDSTALPCPVDVPADESLSDVPGENI